MTSRYSPLRALGPSYAPWCGSLAGGAPGGGGPRA
eukprot:CAMPEP_0119465806 /NCGR_PEP_ID=MMETSP1344-20130328/761_1 /TAXON_ID=236787 /ORGANISM="Florenciella parvula, Strain CCMP2471" /LENGTH=34 /DNA_ID= /DNA_START= /DNA_END= /DNA_ORIENTATION=